MHSTLKLRTLKLGGSKIFVLLLLEVLGSKSESFARSVEELVYASHGEGEEIADEKLWPTYA